MELKERETFLKRLIKSGVTRGVGVSISMTQINKFTTTHCKVISVSGTKYDLKRCREPYDGPFVVRKLLINTKLLVVPSRCPFSHFVSN